MVFDPSPSLPKHANENLPNYGMNLMRIWGGCHEVTGGVATFRFVLRKESTRSASE